MNFPCTCTGVSGSSQYNGFSFPPTRLQAHDVMTERQGVATRLMYQLFVALNRKKVGCKYHDTTTNVMITRDGLYHDVKSPQYSYRGGFTIIVMSFSQSLFIF